MNRVIAFVLLLSLSLSATCSDGTVEGVLRVFAHSYISSKTVSIRTSYSASGTTISLTLFPGQIGYYSVCLPTPNTFFLFTGLRAVADVFLTIGGNIVAQYIAYPSDATESYELYSKFDPTSTVASLSPYEGSRVFVTADLDAESYVSSDYNNFGEAISSTELDPRAHYSYFIHSQQTVLYMKSSVPLYSYSSNFENPAYYFPGTDPEGTGYDWEHRRIEMPDGYCPENRAPYYITRKHTYKTYGSDGLLSLSVICLSPGAHDLNVDTYYGSEVTGEFDHISVHSVFGEQLVVGVSSITAEALCSGSDDTDNSEYLVAMNSSPQTKATVGQGPYYCMSEGDYERDYTMEVIVEKGSFRPTPPPPVPITFDPLSYSLMPFLANTTFEYPQGLSASEKWNHYVISAALNLMEVKQYVSTLKTISTDLSFFRTIPLKLDRNQVYKELSEDCGSCTESIHTVFQYLKRTGVCTVDDSSKPDCKRYKISSYSVEEDPLKKVTNTIIDFVKSREPVFVMLSLDPKQVQHHTSLNPLPINQEAPLKSNEELGTYSYSNFAGVVVGYNGEHASTLQSYWQILMPRNGYRNNMIKVLLDPSGASFGRITRKIITISGIISQ